jgi:hypothetical protein
MKRRKTKNMHPTVVVHPVKIEVGGKYAVAIPPQLKDMRIGEQVQFNTSQKAFRVAFVGWPFEGKKHDVTTDETLTFDKECDFQFYCYVTPRGETKELDYPAGSGGGNGNVKPPGK